MALDGIFLHHIKKELTDKLIDTRVEKVYQPAKEEIVLALKGRNGGHRLLLSARANSPRVNLTNFAPENPLTPPMLCMLLRKKLCGAKLKKIEQPQLERMIKFTFDATNDLGDWIELSLIVEIMGKYSNIILVDDSDKIIDAIKRVDMSMSQKRLVLPTLKYEMPPKQDKTSLLNCETENAVDTAVSNILKLEKNTSLSKALLNELQGVSPIICKEIEYVVGKGENLFVKELTQEHITKLKFHLNKLAKIVVDTKGSPYMFADIKTNKPLDISFNQITQYGTTAKAISFNSFSELLDNYYYERDRVERIKVKAQDLLKLMTNLSDRFTRKIEVQKKELLECENREMLRINGDLVQANVYRIEKGAKFVEVENYFEEDLPIVKIKLDESLSPAQNAQKYYKNYRKAKTAELMLNEQIAKAQEELEYIDSVFDALSRANTESELTEIRNELLEQGYVKKGKEKNKKRNKVQALPFLEFVSETGFKILVGRNNYQNDKLTLKTAKNYDMWFHTKNIPGSHTVIVSDGKEIDEETIILAGSISAYHSKAKESDNVPVDYTIIKNVSKPSGAKPGMVIYKNNKTVYVTPQLPNNKV